MSEEGEINHRSQSHNSRSFDVVSETTASANPPQDKLIVQVPRFHFQHHPRLHCMIAWSFHPKAVITGMHLVRSLRQPGAGHQRPSGHLTASEGSLDHEGGGLMSKTKLPKVMKSGSRRVLVLKKVM